MKQLLDIWPVILFFLVYQWYGIYVATASIMIAVVVQSVLIWWKSRRLSPMQTVTLFLIVLFGGATLVLHDPLFIQWKPTLLQWIFALVFVGSHFVGDKPAIQRLLGSQMVLPPVIWKRVNFSWIVFFIVSGAANLFVAYSFDEETWVRFKLFGLLGMTFVFIVIQGIWLSRYLSEDSPS